MTRRCREPDDAQRTRHAAVRDVHGGSSAALAAFGVLDSPVALPRALTQAELDDLEVLAWAMAARLVIAELE